MNSKFKRLLACLLSLMMVVSLFPMSAITAFAAEADEIATVSEGNVAKVGNTEYATIDEAIAAWTNGTTLTLLSNVTLSDVIKLSSTEYHILDLGTYTMTAASKKDAIQIVNNGRSSASYALDIKADATNPGGITASGKAVVRTAGKSGVKDRPIIRFYNGVFTGSNVVYHSGSNGTNCPQFWFYGGEFNGTIYTNRALNQFYGGTFTGSLMMSVDSSAYTLIAGGTFKNLSNLYMSALNSGKFTIGSAKGVYDKEVYIDDNGNYVIAASEPAQGIEAAVVKNPGTNDYLAYSKVATEGVLKYTDATMALQKNNTSSAEVTIYAEELDLAGIDYKGTIVVPEGKTLKITNAPEGLKVEGEVVVVKPVAKIGETSYNSLSDAIANATAGQTITFLADITEDVTISEAVTIDGNSKTYTGNMTLKADTTIKNVNFDGKGYNGYAVETRGANYLTIVDCTAKNYGYGFVQLASGTALTTVKNVTVSNMNYGVKVDYSSAVVLENVDITAGVAAVLNSNYGEKTITIKNSKLNILGTWTRNNTTKTAYVFEGANTVGQFIIEEALDSFKLAAGATLTAPEGVTVTTDVDGKMVVYTNGTYELDLKHQGGTWGGIDWKLYEDGTLIIAPTKGTPTQIQNRSKQFTVGQWPEAVRYNSKGEGVAIEGWPYSRTAVKTLIIEEGVTSIGSFTAQGFTNLTGEVVIPSTVTYIGQEAFQKSTMTKLTFAKGGTEELCIAQGAFKNLIIEEVALPDDRLVHLHAWVFNNCHNLKSATLPATLVSVHGTNHIDYFKDFNAHSNPTWTQSSEIFAYNENMETITFGSEAVRDMFYAKNNGTSKDYTVANVGLTTYFDLQAAIDAAQDGETVKLIKNVTLTDTLTIPAGKTITLDLSGKTITGTDNATGSFGLITNKGELTITGNGKITLTATNNRGWNAYSSVISNTVGGKLIVENGTIEHLGGTDMAYGIDNLTNGKGTYAETIINGGTIKSTYRGIRQFLNGVEAQNILTINGGVVEGANKSIWVQDPSKNNNTGKITVAEGATLNGDVYLTATAGSTEWPVEVSIAASAVKDEVLTSNLPAGYVLEKKSGNWTVNEYFFKVGNKYYKSLQAAVDAANQYQSVNLLQDAEGAGVVINKKTTIDFGGFTYTLTSPVGSKGTESNGFQILAGNYTVRLLNGTLKVADDAADKFYILVQNYSDLIVQKMTLDGTNLDKYAFTDGDSYTLSNNSGNVQINDAKIIANNDGDKAFAFDACANKNYKLPRVTVYPTSKIEGKIEAAAKVGNYYYATLQQAIDATAEGKTITLLAPIVVKAGETLNLNKKVTISYTSKVAGEDMITNRGAVIVDGATLVYKNTDKTASNVTVSTISCEPGSVLEVKNGVVKNNSANNGALGIYAYAIDMLTNGNLGDVTVTISGGEVIGTNYMAIRQFNNGTACKNTLNVTGGYIYGAKRAIQIHMDNNAAYLAISGGKVEAGKDGYALCLFPKAATNVAVTGGEFVGTIYSGTNGIISGGTFDAAFYEGYITVSYKMVKENGVYKVIFDETYGSIATIGNQKFNSLADAWAAAQDGDTIVLQNNIAIDTETFTVADGKKITLDMNGYTITVTDNSTKNYELFYIYGEMVVTGNGTIELTSTNNRAWNAMSAIFHNRGGVLTIENGTYTNLGGTDMAWVVDNSGNHYGDAVTNINGGTLTSTYTAIRNRMEQNTHGASGKAILNITDGKIDGTTSAIWAQAASVSTVAPATGEINISGGEIGLINTARSEGAVSMTTITGGTVAGFKGESGELKVNGGTITGTITILFADGTEPVKTVVKSKVYYGAVAKMGSTYYATLADAIKKCTGAQAITLLRDIEGEGFVITGKTAIDFNGYTYTVTAPVAGTKVGVQINASGKAVRLINGTLKAADGSGVEVLVENNSNLTIQRQTLAVTSGTALLVKGGSVSINLATIDAEGATAIEVLAGKITVYSEGKSSFINGEKLAKKSGTTYIPVA